MECSICRKEGHAAAQCPEALTRVERREFSPAELVAKEKEIRDVEASFVDKVLSVVGKIPFALDAAAMYYCLRDPKTPFWVKASIAGALLYFISPIDAIPDFIPVVGYADDAAMIYASMALVHKHITDEHIAEAKALLKQTT